MPRILTREDAWYICEHRFKRPAKELAAEMGVDHDVVLLIWRNKRHRNLGHPNQYDNARVRLTKTDHDAIKLLYGVESPEEIAARYGVNPKTILNIWRG